MLQAIVATADFVWWKVDRQEEILDPCHKYVT